jgi:hypothetical protein
VVANGSQTTGSRGNEYDYSIAYILNGESGLAMRAGFIYVLLNQFITFIKINHEKIAIVSIIIFKLIFFPLYSQEIF